MQSVKKSAPFLALALVAFALIAFLAFPSKNAWRVAEGLSLWASLVLPALLPFLFFTAILTRMKAFPALAKRASPFFKAAFRVSGAGGIAALLSALSGYPVGARTLYDLKQRGAVKQEEVFRLAALCSTSGPAFVVGVVGAGMLRSPALGWALFLAHLAGVYLVCFFLRFLGKPAPSLAVSVPMAQGDWSDALIQSALSALSVGVAIAVFYALSGMLLDVCNLVNLSSPALRTLLTGFMEMTAGCQQACAFPKPLAAALCCFFVTFGGACVLLQQFSYFYKAGVRILPFLAVKLAQAFLSALLAFGLSFLV